MGYKNHPSWSLKGASYTVPDQLSQWELFLLTEGISDKDLNNNPKVLKFILKNVRTYFIPTKILKLYGQDYDDA